MEMEKNKKALQCMSARGKKGRTITMAAEMDRVQTTCRNRMTNIGSDDEIDISDVESVEIETRVKSLRRLVPGGENMETETLFEETADYIEELRGQVMMMRSLADFFDAVTREKRLSRR